MKTAVECWECKANAFSKIVKESIKDEAKAYEAICRIVKSLGEVYSKACPADIGTMINRIIAEYVEDPFYEKKKESTNSALLLFEHFKDVEISIENAVKLAAYGNIMDYTVQDWEPNSFDVESILSAKLSINHMEYLESEIRRAKTVMYLSDNAGEVVMDYFLIKYLKNEGKKVILSPKAGPMQNDATIEDVKGTPVFDIVDEIVPCAAAVGLNYEESSDEFKAAFKEADMLILKGMGNFENAFEIDKNAFFILKAKCLPVARYLKVNRGDNILVWNQVK